MRFLLDSHILLWYDDSSRLDRDIRHRIDTAEAVYISAASVWELTVKQTAGKLAIARPVVKAAAAFGMELLSISAMHAQLAGELPLHHRDPFDRMLVAQAMLENLTLVTHDRTLSRYSVPILLV